MRRSGYERFHHAITGAFPPARAAAERARHEPPPELVSRFERDGFVAGIPVLDRPRLEELRRRLDALVARLPEIEPDLYEVEAAHLDRPGEVALHLLGAWLVDPWFHDLVFAPEVTVPCARLLGVDRLRFWHDQVFLKPPRHPGVVPWHQDYSYWTRAAPPRHITLNLVLDDTSAENGCVHFVPGSHRWPLLPKVSFGGPMEQVLDRLGPAERAAFRPVPAPVRAGEATIHHSHTLHGSFGNRSDRPRRAIVLNYMAPDTRSAGGDAELLRGTGAIPAGAVIEGPFFPIVLPAGG